MTKVKIITGPPKEWAKAIKKWENVPKAGRDAWRKKNAAVIDRWQSETDAMALSAGINPNDNE
jgi:hypothetical protein